MVANNEFLSRIQQLEEKLAFQEDTLEQLNHVIADQSLEIQKLWDANRLLRKKMDEVQVSDQGQEPPPPHY